MLLIIMIIIVLIVNYFSKQEKMTPEEYKAYKKSHPIYRMWEDD